MKKFLFLSVALFGLCLATMSCSKEEDEVPDYPEISAEVSVLDGITYEKACEFINSHSYDIIFVVAKVQPELFIYAGTALHAYPSEAWGGRMYNIKYTFPNLITDKYPNWYGVEQNYKIYFPEYTDGGLIEAPSQLVKPEYNEYGVPQSYSIWYISKEYEARPDWQ
jgi:hypothetical protein